ncbi:toluene tolerance protein [Pseudomonas sp. SP16.1]|uniref:toluene tolerance protein n=1 Tax=Pseudomonas sp. SP16.1 TaxID=3458854 RepID=UPI0040460ADE
MRIVTAQELESWLASGKVLEQDARGPKVVALADGHFLKIFHTRKAAPLARLMPPAQRFARNAELLQRQGIVTPRITETFWLDRSKGLSACLYLPLAGQSLEQLLRNDPERLEQLLPALSRFILELHTKRLYFRSLHLGNILTIGENSFGLIDFLDLCQKTLPLTRWHVRRNFRHLENYLRRRRIIHFPIKKLEELYWNHAKDRLFQVRND